MSVVVFICHSVPPLLHTVVNHGCFMRAYAYAAWLRVTSWESDANAECVRGSGMTSADCTLTQRNTLALRHQLSIYLPFLSISLTLSLSLSLSLFLSLSLSLFLSPSPSSSHSLPLSLPFSLSFSLSLFLPLSLSLSLSLSLCVSVCIYRMFFFVYLSLCLTLLHFQTLTQVQCTDIVGNQMYI